MHGQQEFGGASVSLAFVSLADSRKRDACAALHLAFAEHLKADYFVTVDDEMLARGQRAQLPVQLLDAVELIKELGL